jgi:hypothetical protein
MLSSEHVGEERRECASSPHEIAPQRCEDGGVEAFAEVRRDQADLIPRLRRAPWCRILSGVSIVVSTTGDNMTTTRLASLTIVGFVATAHAENPAALDREHEIALALEAGPETVTAKAGVWIHDKTGYIKARESQNGFVCVVDHRVPAAVEPQCLDAEGVKTFLPKYQLVASLRAGGKSEADIRKRVKAAFDAGTLRAPARPGVIYMMSPHNVVTVNEEKGIAVPFPGHLMFYAPNLTSADLGSDGAPTSPLFVVDEKTPHALMIVPVPIGPGSGHSHGKAP